MELLVKILNCYLLLAILKKKLPLRCLTRSGIRPWTSLFCYWKKSFLWHFSGIQGSLKIFQRFLVKYGRWLNKTLHGNTENRRSSRIHSRSIAGLNVHQWFARHFNVKPKAIRFSPFDNFGHKLIHYLLNDDFMKEICFFFFKF